MLRYPQTDPGQTLRKDILGIVRCTFLILTLGQLFLFEQYIIISNKIIVITGYTVLDVDTKMMVSLYRLAFDNRIMIIKQSLRIRPHYAYSLITKQINTPKGLCIVEI